MNARFAARLDAARAEVAPDAPGARAFYRRAVTTLERRERAPPESVPAGLRVASNGVAVLLTDAMPPSASGRLAASIDDALAAARAAGAEWAVVFTDDADAVAVLRDLEFQPM